MISGRAIFIVPMEITVVIVVHSLYGGKRFPTETRILLHIESYSLLRNEQK